jgi:hypothetical protein
MSTDDRGSELKANIRQRKADGSYEYKQIDVYGECKF